MVLGVEKENGIALTFGRAALNLATFQRDKKTLNTNLTSFICMFATGTGPRCSVSKLVSAIFNIQR